MAITKYAVRIIPVQCKQNTVIVEFDKSKKTISGLCWEARKKVLDEYKRRNPDVEFQIENAQHVAETLRYREKEDRANRICKECGKEIKDGEEVIVVGNIMKCNEIVEGTAAPTRWQFR